MSRLWGWLNSLTVPVWLREPLYGTYSKAFGCNLDEMQIEDLKAYRNLGDFFYRSLKPGARPIDEQAPLVSPADGRVLHFGLITERKVEQIKGFTYSLDSLLGIHPTDVQPESKEDVKLIELAQKTGSETVVSDKAFAEVNAVDYSLDKLLGDEPGQALTGKDAKAVGWVENNNGNGNGNGAEKGEGKALEYSHKHGGHRLRPGNGLFFCVIYLAPGDYHRFHSPAEWNVKGRRHFAGELFSVSPMAVEAIRNLFVLNERVVLLGDWKPGFFAMIPVGATNVGAIKIDFDPTLRTNLAKRLQTVPPGTFTAMDYGSNGVDLQKGQEIGGFMLGSTIVLVFEAPTNFKFELEQGQKVRVGEPLGRFK
ncbi:phosphatidylserine decarboxylase 1 [Rhizophlyctis rosea]|uniref:Phosphatidylserine decarboxylase proenzyme 1, mitochondrial n=1 Tax=Rhizophlyctis rosea TaxID=64517 RepID=A0AAD5SG72_9FUNG|nr:phosphatidylserine decarboxylase 1 [Rhizophlyctis rosea]